MEPHLITKGVFVFRPLVFLEVSLLDKQDGDIHEVHTL